MSESVGRLKEVGTIERLVRRKRFKIQDGNYERFLCG